MEARAIFLNPFTVSQFVICQLADKEINESYTCANGLNGLSETKRSKQTCPPMTVGYCDLKICHVFLDW
jgi:hypothetical protein